MQPHEVACLTQLATAGAHPEVLAQVFGRDVRTIRALLRQAGVRSRSGVPLSHDWRRGLPPATVAAIRAAVTRLCAQEQTAWQRLRQVALEVTATAYTFPSPETYDAVLQTVQPAETPLALARRLGVDINRVLLAYVEVAAVP
jgi:hypothetical protein